MKRLPIIAAASALASLYSTSVFASEASAEAATESTMSAAVLPSEESSAGGVVDPAADANAEDGAPTGTDQRTAKNAIYLDLMGAGGIYSVNYSRIITDDLAASIGFSYIGYGASTSSGGATASADFSLTAIPISVSYLGIGSLSNMFEVGGGGSIMMAKGDGLVSAGSSSNGGSASATILALSPFAGYRHQAPDGGFVFRVGAQPLIFLGGEGGVLPWGYMSLGAGF